MQETLIWSLGGEDPLGKEMATHSSILSVGNPMDRKEPGGLQSMGLQTVGCHLMTKQQQCLSTYMCISVSFLPPSLPFSLFSFFLIFPILLSCNWRITLCSFNVHNARILYIYILRNNYHNKVSYIQPLRNYNVCVGNFFKTYSFGNFQVSNAVLLTTECF